MSARGRALTATTARSSSASTRRSSPSSTTSTVSGSRRRSGRSTTRSRSTATTRSGGPSTTTTGRRSTSSTGTASSATTTSAKDATSNRSASSSGCSASSAQLDSVEGVGVEAEADWDHLRTPETYLGYGRSEHLASPDGAALDQHRVYELPGACASTTGHASASGRSGPRTSCSSRPAGASPTGSTRATRTSCCHPERASRFPSACSSTARPGARHTAWTSTRTGTACSRDCRLNQLVREHDAVRERTLEIMFLEPGAEAYAFTLG